MNHEFNQLLLDLEEGLLLPSKLELSNANSDVSAVSISDRPPLPSSEQLGVLGVARLINTYQVCRYFHDMLQAGQKAHG